MQTLRFFAHLAAGYWRSPRRWYAWALFIAVVATAMGIIEVGVFMAEWNKRFYDAIAAYSADILPSLVLEYLVYITIVVALVVGGSWMRKRLVFDWREHLTAALQRRWLSCHRHYRLQFEDEPDNPDQRIAEDVAMLADSTVDMVRNFLMNAFKLVAFVAVLWEISGTLRFTLWGHEIVVKGYLVWIAVIYSAVCTLCTHFIGRPLRNLNIARQHREADFRTTLLRTRESGEQIASLGGERAEYRRLAGNFAAIRRNYLALIFRELKLEVFSASYLRITNFIPVIATLPMYIARVMTFGDMMQARSAFWNVQDGFGWFMDYYKRLMVWAAVVQRLGNFEQRLSQVPDLPEHDCPSERGCAFNAQNLTVLDPRSGALWKDLTLSLRPGNWLRLLGPSGCGKSSFLRTVAGIWPFYTGKFAVSGHCVLVPQKPYLPPDTLRRVLTYPDMRHAADDTLLRQCLAETGLEKFCGRLGEHAYWSKELSGGEAQRVSLIRAVLAEPDLLLLDEATSALDTQNAQALCAFIKRRLPRCAVIGVTHQPELASCFDQVLSLDGKLA